MNDRRFVLIIELAVYGDSDIPRLSGVERDAGRLRETLEGCKDERVLRLDHLWNENASKQAIIGKLQEIAREVGTTDQVVVYFGGHGRREWNPERETKSYYLLPYDAAFATAVAQAISTDELGALLNAMRAKEIVVILDCCHSGGMVGLPWTDDTLKELLEGWRSHYVMAAARGREEAGEDDYGGFFMQALCNALEGQGINPDDEGRISAQKAWAHAADETNRVAALRGHQQVAVSAGIGSSIYLTRLRQPGRKRFIDSDIGLPNNWVDKKWDGDRLEELLKQTENPPRVIAIQDIGGAGKSSFARWFLDELLSRGLTFDVEIWFSFYRMRDVSEPFGRFLDYVLDKLDPDTDRPPGMKTSQKRERLEQICRERSIIFFLDGLEVAQVADGSSRWMKEEDAERFLKDACNFPQGCIVITTREPLRELDGNRGFHRFKLSDWTPEAIYAYMKRAGVQGIREEIQRVVDVLGVHSLLLAVFAGTLRDYYDGRIENASAVIAEIGRIPGTEEPQLDLDRQERKLGTIIEEIVTRLDPKALELMTTLSALSGAASEDMFELLRGDLRDIDFRRMIHRLAASALLVVGERGDRRTCSAHALIKACFYRRMTDAERMPLHRRLADYFQGRPEPVDPRVLTDLDDLTEWFWQCVRGEYFDEALRVTRDANLGKFLYDRGWYDAELDLLQSLVHNGAKVMPPQQLTFVWRLIGNIHRKLGRVPEAINAFQTAQAIAEAARLQPETLDASVQVAITYGFQGDFARCQEILANLPAVAKFVLEAPRLEWLGYATAVQGDRASGLDVLIKAEKLCRWGDDHHKPDDRHLAPTLTHIGDVLLLFDDQVQEREKARKIYEESLRICEARTFKDYEGDARRGLGDYHRLEGSFEEAGREYESALKIAREIGYRFLLTEVWIAMARLAEQQGKNETVQSCVGEAMDLARASGYLVQQGECLLIQARESLRGGGRVSDEEIREIRSLAERTHHRRLQSELEALLEQLTR